MAFLLWSGLTACSESSNLNGIIARNWAAKDPKALISHSEILFDQGDYAGALKSAQDAYSLAPYSSACAVQLSYSLLGVAGLDLFQLARKMIEKSASSPAAESSSLADTGNAAGQLVSLASLVGLTAEDYEAITLPDNRLGELEGAPTTGPFRDLPVFLPKSAPEARSSSSATIQGIALATRVLCPFMPDEVKLLGDSGDIRHLDASCESREFSSHTKSKALFVWAVAHLIEAVAFNQVVLYQPDGQVPNLQHRTTLIGDRSVISSLSDYTFQNMPAVPAAIAKDIVSAIDQLKGQKDQLGSGNQAKDQRSVAFKDQLTEKMASELQTQISAKIDSGQVNETERIKLCQAYRTISTGTFASCDGT
ncbi:MAG: hypothetical protein NTX25_07605 [Proteobacteria bacterium]|nr:hypothetical protein [Pseudomonadota bacterium]